MFLLGSLLPNITQSHVLSWYGILRGDSIISYKSPVNGIVEYLNCTRVQMRMIPTYLRLQV